MANRTPPTRAESPPRQGPTVTPPRFGLHAAEPAAAEGAAPARGDSDSGARRQGFAPGAWWRHGTRGANVAEFGGVEVGVSCFVPCEDKLDVV